MAISNSDRNSPAEKFGAAIAELRVRKGLTQAALSQQLGVTHQAVSQWECGDTMPDILLLPKLAAALGVTIDSLFGINRQPQADIALDDLPNNDGKLRAVLFIGNKMVKSQKIEQKLIGDNRIVFKYQGPALNVESHMSLECGDVQGNATAGHSLKCGNVNGSANAGHSLSCENVGQNASAGHGMTIRGDVGGDARAGHALSCHNVRGSVRGGHSVVINGMAGGIVNGD